MAERERERVREREAPDLNSYEVAIKADREFQERQRNGRIVVKFADCPQGLYLRVRPKVEKDVVDALGGR